MYSEDITKKRLLLGFEVSKLYVKTGLSGQELSVIIGIPKSSVKRYTNMIRIKKKLYLDLLPELMTEDEIDLFINYIEKRHHVNKRTSGWNTGESLSNLNDISVDVNKIRKLYSSINQTISVKKKQKMKQMREEGKTYREIARISGTSLSHTYKSVIDLEKNTTNTKNDLITPNPSMGGRHI